MVQSFNYFNFTKQMVGNDYSSDIFYHNDLIVDEYEDGLENLAEEDFCDYEKELFENISQGESEKFNKGNKFTKDELNETFEEFKNKKEKKVKNKEKKAKKLKRKIYTTQDFGW